MGEVIMTGFVFFEDDHKQRIEGRYWGNKGIAIIASITKGIDWAAYIGAAPGISEEDALSLVAREGDKLSEKDARHFFPNIELPYRR